MALWRAVAACEIGREALDFPAEVPAGVNPLEYAVYNLLQAVEDLARAEAEQDIWQ